MMSEVKYGSAKLKAVLLCSVLVWWPSPYRLSNQSFWMSSLFLKQLVLVTKIHDWHSSAARMFPE